MLHHKGAATGIDGDLHFLFTIHYITLQQTRFIQAEFFTIKSLTRPAY